MSIQKKVIHFLPAVEIDMGGFHVKQPLPTAKVDQLDPYLLVHHARSKFSDNRPAKTQGIGPHPHRGFSPVTFVIEGELHHRDSRGNNQVALAGEVQWMHAGLGIVHSERPSEALTARKGVQEIIQIWINSPAERKMIEPEYTHLDVEHIPVVFSEDKKIANKVVAGSYEGKSSGITLQSDLLILWGTSEIEGSQTIRIPKDFNAMLYLIRGSMSISGYGLVEKESLLIFEEEGDEVSMSFSETSQFILMCGVPINEEVTHHGPFVMNTQTEIMEAMRDYQIGKMGVLIEED